MTDSNKTKNKRLKLFVVLLAAVMMIVAAASCGNDSNTGTKTAEPVVTEAPTGVIPEDQTEAPATGETVTDVPTGEATAEPTAKPTDFPTAVPTEVPTEIPTEVPTVEPTATPTIAPTATPTKAPTATPAKTPTPTPTKAPTPTPTKAPTDRPTATPEPTPKKPTTNVTGFSLGADNTQYNNELAIKLMHLCADDKSKEGTAARMQEAGLEVLVQKNYDKNKTDASHTSPYTLGYGLINMGGTKKTVYVIAIAPTNNGEWLSNFDFAPSHSEDVQFAENFYMAAVDAFNNTKAKVLADPDALLVICGYSRGGSVANLLGYLYNEERNTALNYVYTYAAGLTVHKKADESDTVGGYWDNIFNIVNSADAICEMPFAEHGFYRKGNDVVLQGGSTADSWKSLKKDLLKISPTITSYYGDKHNLKAAGLSDDGMTLFDLLYSLIRDVIDAGVTEFSTDSFNQLKNTPTVKLILTIDKKSDLYPVRALVEPLTKDMFTAGMAALRYYPIVTAHEASTYLSLLGET